MGSQPNMVIRRHRTGVHTDAVTTRSGTAYGSYGMSVYLSRAGEGGCARGCMLARQDVRQDHKRSKNSTVAKGTDFRRQCGGSRYKNNPGGSPGSPEQPAAPLCVSF